MSTFDPAFWEEHWARTRAEHDQQVAERPPSPHLAVELAELEPGIALDAGCGDGVNAIWLAQRGWRVVAIDIAESALAIARARAAAAGAEIAERITWVAGDLQYWTPKPGLYDLVACLYVHTPGSVAEMVQRLATGVAPGGTFLFVGHSPHERGTKSETITGGEREVGVETVLHALDSSGLELTRAEAQAHRGAAIDSVVRARRRA